MAIYGYIWLYMAIYGYIWLYMAIYGYIWLYWFDTQRNGLTLFSHHHLRKYWPNQKLMFSIYCTNLGLQLLNGHYQELAHECNFINCIQLLILVLTQMRSWLILSRFPIINIYISIRLQWDPDHVQSTFQTLLKRVRSMPQLASKWKRQADKKHENEDAAHYLYSL